MPFEVGTVADLEKVGTGVDGWNLDSDYIQTADIDFADVYDKGAGWNDWNAGEGWDILGTNADPFLGTYNGNKKRIINLYINKGGSAVKALFGYLAGAHVYDLGLDDVDIQGTGGGSRNSAMYYSLSESTVERCYMKGSVQAGTAYGSFGGTASQSLIKDCYAVEDNDMRMFHSLSADSTIENCYTLSDDLVNPALDDGTTINSYKSTDDLLKIATFDGWDIKDIGISGNDTAYIWNIVNDVYEPFFSWEAVTIPAIYYFLKTPNVSITGPKATHVKVKDRATAGTATANVTPEPPEAERIYRFILVDDGGGVGVLQTIADQLIEKWGREQVTVSGEIPLNVTLDFMQKLRVIVPQGNVDADLILQKKSHNITTKTTAIVAGDIMLSDDELIARILDEL